MADHCKNSYIYTSDLTNHTELYNWLNNIGIEKIPKTYQPEDAFYGLNYFGQSLEIFLCVLVLIALAWHGYEFGIK
jgi:hypothetical protein